MLLDLCFYSCELCESSWKDSGRFWPDGSGLLSDFTGAQREGMMIVWICKWKNIALGCFLLKWLENMDYLMLDIDLCLDMIS